MAARTVPEVGDIVVREDAWEGTRVYVLLAARGADQYLVRSRQEAVTQAVTFAKRECVRAWVTDEGYDCVLLEDFRVVGSVQTTEGRRASAPLTMHTGLVEVLRDEMPDFGELQLVLDAPQPERQASSDLKRA